MKTAKQWEQEFHADGLCVYEYTIKRIQASALAAAAEVCLEVAKVSGAGTDCAAAIIKEAEKLNILKEAVATKEFAKFTCKFGQGEACCKYE